MHLRQYLCFLHLSLRDVQLDTFMYNSLPIRHVFKLPCLLLPVTVFLVDSDIGPLPVYRLTSAGDHHPLVVGDLLEIDIWVQGFFFERLIAY